jgi:hypothetical protein
MASERAINPNVEREVMQLLYNYRQTYDYGRALAKLEQNYDVYQRDIQESTAALGIRGGAGVETFEQANELLEIAKFNANKTIYKKIGLFLGVDPEFFEEFRVDEDALPREFYEKVKDFFKVDSSTKNIVYENNQQLPISSLSYGAPSGRRFSSEAIFFQNSISQYFIDLGIYLNNKNNTPNTSNQYILFLRDYIFGLLQQMLNAIPELSPDIPIGGGEKSDPRNRLVSKTKSIVSKRIEQINDYLDGSLVVESTNIDKFQNSLYYFIVASKTDDGAYLRDLLRQVINDEQGDFNTVFKQADDLLNVIYEDRLRKIEQSGLQTNENVLVNRQLQDILAFFGAATLREEDDTPEGSIRRITEAPKSIGDVLEAPKLKPFDFQCYLLENIAKITEKRRIDGPYESSYKNVIPINTKLGRKVCRMLEKIS